MQVSVEKTSELSRKMTVSIPEEVVQEKMEVRFKSLAREVKLDGFRPGKVPLNVIKKKFADRVRGEVSGDLIQSTYFEALQQQDLIPAGHPHIHPADNSEGFEYVAEFEVYPEISLDVVDQLEITRTSSTVEEADLDQMIDKLREQKKDWNAVERASQENDRVTIHFSGVCDGENFTDGKVENYQVVIGGKQMISGFEEELVGLEAGASKTFDITFPEQYGNDKLAGKQAQFEIEVIKVEEPVLPEVNADFIKAYGIEDGEMSSFRDDVKTNMERELEQALKGKLKNAVMDAIYQNITVTTPKALVDQEIQQLMQPYAENAKKQNLKLEDLDLPRDAFEEQAKRRVALGLILGEIIQKNEIKVDNEKVRETIENMANSYEKPEDVINWYYADDSRLDDVRQIVLEDQAVEWVVNKAKLSDETVKFDEVMSGQHQH
ncbi:trigger factor [Methylomarinum sp. Ch1-1]|uniref:Trigger factor n=1 Tax=Methylomarinum roseum TaxID=3067653 RepID=A0AAU7NZ84_9GAMM|nr:trigger factor [Methylomarinum sp. Ch1-1]MDP4521556.1 trigger factor [Methylomarinum sp. Ch1-1]